MTILADNFLQPGPFFIDFADTYLHGDTLSLPDKTEDAPAILFLHGCSRAEDRNSLQLLRQLLLNKYGLSSCSFDFIGHGGTGGSWGCSTFEVRTRQAIDIVDACFDCQPLSIVAIGMSAGNALKMLPECSVSNLVLINPMLYDADIYTMPFCDALGCQAQGALALNGEKSDVWDIVRGFQGGLCSIVGEHGVGERTEQKVAAALDQQAIASCRHYVLPIEGISVSSSAAQSLTNVSGSLCKHDAQPPLMDFASSDPTVIAAITHAIAETCSPSVTTTAAASDLHACG